MLGKNHIIAALFILIVALAVNAAAFDSGNYRLNTQTNQFELISINNSSSSVDVGKQSTIVSNGNSYDTYDFTRGGKNCSVIDAVRITSRVAAESGPAILAQVRVKNNCRNSYHWFYYKNDRYESVVGSEYKIFDCTVGPNEVIAITADAGHFDLLDKFTMPSNASKNNVYKRDPATNKWVLQGNWE